MSILTNILYWLSTGMLTPVVLLLLIAFGWALMLIGDIYGQFVRRLGARQSATTLSDAARNNQLSDINPDASVHANSTLRRTVAALIEQEWHEIHGDKIICDYEADCRRSVESAVLLMRVGPMLGLMGTLIPMGPALVGLAAGDIASMAQNMQVAFSTTVLGIFVGAVGLVAQLLMKRWYQSDSELLRYLLEAKNSETNKVAEAHQDNNHEEAA